MTATPLAALLLPGMDGTGRLFGPLLAALPPEIAPRVVSYPSDRALGYADLEPLVPLPTGQPFAIVAESFSGPLAIRIAARAPAGLRALVLVASFVRSPVPLAARALAGLLLPRLFSFRPPAAALRALLLGRDAPDEAVAGTADAIASVRPEVLAARLREILAVNVSRELSAVRAPILYLAGARDRLVRTAALRAILAVRRDVRAVTLDAPHFVLQRAPHDAAQAIVAFARSATARR